MNKRYMKLIKVKLTFKQKDIPVSLAPYLSRYALLKSYTLTNDIFLCRLYYLTKAFKRARGFPKEAEYELGDVYLHEKYRGKVFNGKKYSRLLIEMIPNKKLLLWTTADNISAIMLYQHYFTPFQGNEKWFKIFAKKNKWVLNKRIVFMKNF